MVCGMVSVRYRAGFPFFMSAGSRQTSCNSAILPESPHPPTLMGFRGSPVRAERTQLLLRNAAHALDPRDLRSRRRRKSGRPDYVVEF